MELDVEKLNQLNIDANSYIDRIYLYDINNIPYNILSEYYAKNKEKITARKRELKKKLDK